MKKLVSTLIALMMLCAACAASADMEIPSFDSMSPVVFEDENTTVEESAFAGEWVLNVAFIDTEYVDEQTLAGTYDFNFMPFVIGDGKITQDAESGEGEFVTYEMPYVFDAGQLQATFNYGKNDGLDYAVELLEDGNIVMSIFLPREDGTNSCLSVYLVHPAE